MGTLSPRMPYQRFQELITNYQEYTKQQPFRFSRCEKEKEWAVKQVRSPQSYHTAKKILQVTYFRKNKRMGSKVLTS